jgi:hypothetical protein
MSSWDQRFFDPITLPDGRKLVALRARCAYAGPRQGKPDFNQRLVIWNGHSGARVLAYKPAF